MSVFGYVRCSTYGQELDNQKARINEVGAREGLKISFVEEMVSSSKRDRKIFYLVEQLEPGDTIIVYELSRLARSLGEIYSIVEGVKKRKGSLWVLEPEMRIGAGEDSIAVDALLFALGIGARVERDLISERTKNALNVRKAQGVRLGRPPGKGVKVREALQKKGLSDDKIKKYYKNKILSASAIARMLGLDARTVRAWLLNSVDSNKV